MFSFDTVLASNVLEFEPGFKKKKRAIERHRNRLSFFLINAYAIP